jgi:NinB protein
MQTSLTIDLHNVTQARAAIKHDLFPFLGQWLKSGKKLVLSVKLRTRTSQQNRRYWGAGVLAQVAEQAMVNGRLYSAEIWHEQFKRMFLGFDELPNGEVIAKSSKGLTTVEFCLFCVQVESYAATELGVTFFDLAPQDGSAK